MYPQAPVQANQNNRIKFVYTSFRSDSRQCPTASKGDTARNPLTPIESIPLTQVFSTGWVHIHTSLFRVWNCHIGIHDYLSNVSDRYIGNTHTV